MSIEVIAKLIAERERMAWVEGRALEAMLLAAIEDGCAESHARGYKEGSEKSWDDGYESGLLDGSHDSRCDDCEVGYD